ncbi:MAG TPA: DUF503 domain-containing protein [Candidatus Omnitrophota bacterium]|nr:DUF503 domain-containing protein [Candidatus Omnitrophota bacterium]HRY85495.1 DUF503 domain-containing protein [Candidatus Omnitrophota bacterium]
MKDRATAHIGVLTAEFFIPEAHSLKEKRFVLNSLRDRIRNEFNASSAEIGYRDKWQRSEWVFCFAGSDKTYLEGAIGKLLDFLRSGRHASLIDHHVEFL